MENSISLLATLDSKSGTKEIYSSEEMVEIENSVVRSWVDVKGSFSIYIDKVVIEDYVQKTDRTLKMKSGFQLNEKDPDKANVEFLALVSKISDTRIREKLIVLRNKVVSEGIEMNTHEYAQLSEQFETYGYGFTDGQKALKLIAGTRFNSR